MTPPEIWIALETFSDEIFVGAYATREAAESRSGGGRVRVYRYVLDQRTREYKYENDPTQD